MGREQRRKEAKRIKNKEKAEEISNESMMKISTILKIIFSVLVIILVLYYILAVFVTKEIDVSGNKDNSNNSSNSETNNSNNVNNKILAASTFRQTDQVYYVYYYDFDDENDEISGLINNLVDHNIYRVDTGSSLNSNYITDNSGNKSVSDINSLKVINPTIIKIDNDKVVEYHEGVSDIVSFLSK